MGEAYKTRRKIYSKIRIRVHRDPFVAGLLGTQKLQYNLWGDTVNVASKMENNNEAGEVNISASTYELIKEETDYTFTSQGRNKRIRKG
jgi:adenylate cyclase